MVGEPTVSAASMTITSVMKIYGQYQAYKNSKIRETDKGLREEIGRRTDIILTHVNTLENRFLESSSASHILVLNKIRECLTDLSNDVQFGIVGGSSGVNSSVKKLKKKQIQSLITHDLAVLERLVKSTHKVNFIVDLTNKDEEISRSELLELEQQLNGVKNRYSDRVTFLGELK